jgi:hypothetical protein
VGPEQGDLLYFYLDVADQLHTKIFLWGALVQALVLELKVGNLLLVQGLVEKAPNNRLLRSALVEALVHFGEGNRKKAEEFIQALVGQLTPLPKSFFSELARLRSALWPVQDEDMQDQQQKTIVVEAAMRLRLTGLLENLAVEPSPWLRNLAAQNIFYLWKQDHDAGFKVLDALSSRVRGPHGLPDLGAMESVLALIGAILGFEHKDPQTLQSLLRIGRQALRRLLYLGDLDKVPTIANRLRMALLGLVYNLVTGVVFRFAFRTLRSWGEHAWASPKAMEHYFKLSQEQKDLIRTMIPYMDYEEPGFEKRIPDMIKILEWADQLSQCVVEYAILGNGVHSFEKTLEICRQLVEYGLSFKPPRFWTGGSLWNLWQSATHLKDPPSEEFLSLMERVTTAIQDDPALWLAHARRDRSVPLSSDNRASNIGNHMGGYYVFTKRAEIPPLIQMYLERAMQVNDEEYIVEYIREFVGIFELGHHHIAIAGLKPVANYKSETVEQALIDFLVRARNYDPEYVEDLLLREEFPREIANRVLANPSSERLADLLTYQLITVVYDLFILGPKSLRNELKWLFYKSLEMPSLQDFVVLVIREIFNVVLGEVVFSVPPDAPSRQSLKTH